MIWLFFEVGIVFHVRTLTQHQATRATFTTPTPNHTITHIHIHNHTQTTATATATATHTPPHTSALTTDNTPICRLWIYRVQGGGDS